MGQVVDGDRSYLIECISWYHLSILSWILLISLSRSGTIGQDKVEVNTCTIFTVIFRANELINYSRLEPLLKDRCFIWKLQQGINVFAWANNL